MTDELKPCRCGCGGEAQVFFPFTNNIYMIECKKCGICTSAYETETEAVMSWNRAMGATDTNVGDKERTAKVSNQIFNNSNPYTVGAWIGTCECGELVSYSSKYCHMCGARLEWKADEQV